MASQLMLTEEILRRETKVVARWLSNIDQEVTAHFVSGHGRFHDYLFVVSAGDKHIDCPLDRADRFMSLDDFSNRVIQPLVILLARELTPMPVDDAGQII